jgi:hypothetical protein
VFPLQQVRLELYGDEELLVEFAEFEFVAMQNALEQFARSTKYIYNEHHIKTIMDRYTEKYIQKQLVTKNIATARGIGNNIIEWQYQKGFLMLTLEDN